MKKNKICVVICCREFSSKISKLLNDIQTTSKFDEYEIFVVLVFNFSIKISNSEYRLIKYSLNKVNFKITYEKKRGIANVRNHALKLIKKLKFDYCSFLDDDCRISKNFFINHLNFLKKSNSNIVTGPQIYKSKNKLFKIFERNFKIGKVVSWASTNNVFFKRKILNYNIFFSNKVSKYGFGEDQLFFLKLNKLGETIIWNNNPVYEIRQIDRENIMWFINRNYKYGLTGLLIDRELYSFVTAYFLNIFKAIYNLLKSVFYLAFFLILPKDYLYFSLGYFLRFIGRVYKIFYIR